MFNFRRLEKFYLFIYAFYIGASHTLQIDSMKFEYKHVCTYIRRITKKFISM